MDSTADLIIVSQLDLLDTAGTPRQSETKEGRPEAGRIYRKPGPARTQSELDAVKLEGGGVEIFNATEEDGEEKDSDETHLVSPDSSHQTITEDKILFSSDHEILKSALLSLESPPQSGFKAFIQTNLGLLWMLLAACLFCIMSISVKAMTLSGEKLPTLEIVFVRSSVVWVMGVCGMIYWGVDDWLLGPKGVRGLLVLRGMIGFGGLTCGWFALSMLTLADSTVLGFLSPVFTAVLARVILKEPYELLDAITGTLSMVGVMFIARPSFLFGTTQKTVLAETPDDLIGGGMGDFAGETITDDPSLSSEFTTNYTSIYDSTTVAASIPTPTTEDTHLLGVFIALIGATFGALVYIVVRRLSGRATPMHIVTIFSLVSIPLSLLFTLILPSPHPWILPRDPITYMYLFLVASSAYGGQICLSKSLALEKAGKASSMNYVQVVVAFLAEWIVWGVTPSFWSLIGSAIVGSCVIIIAVAKVRGREKK